MKEWVAEYGGMIFAAIIGVGVIVALSRLLEVITI